MPYSSLSLERSVLDKINSLYESLNKGGLFKNKSTFLELIADFFLESEEHRKMLLRYWIERNPELMAVLSAVSGNGQGVDISKEVKSAIAETLGEEIGGFEGLEDKEI